MATLTTLKDIDTRKLFITMVYGGVCVILIVFNVLLFIYFWFSNCWSMHPQRKEINFRKMVLIYFMLQLVVLNWFMCADLYILFILIGCIGSSTQQCWATLAPWTNVTRDDKASLEFFTPPCSYWYFFHCHASWAQVLLMPIPAQFAEL